MYRRFFDHILLGVVQVLIVAGILLLAPHTVNAEFSGIQFLQEKNAIVGDELEPEKLITKGEFIKWLLIADGFIKENFVPQTTKTFADISEEHDLFPYVAFMIDMGGEKVKSASGKFLPDAPINTITALKTLFFVKG